MDRRSFLGATAAAAAVGWLPAMAKLDTSADHWKLNFAPNIGLTSLDTGLFRASVGSDDPVAHIDWIADRVSLASRTMP